MAMIAPDELRSVLAEYCRRHHIRWLALFGSVARGEARPESDLDVLVEFEPGQVPGFAITRLQDELSTLLGTRPVDLVTVKSLNPRIRDLVLAEAHVLYEGWR